MKKMFTILLVIFGILALPKIVQGAVSSSWERYPHSKGTFHSIPKSLKHPVGILLRCPPARELLGELKKEGPVSLVFSPLGENAANAMWKADTRQIVINSSKRRGIPDFIRSILFEMHNARTKDRFAELDLSAKRGTLSKERYVHSIEQLEHQNALKTKELITWGIKEKYFPLESAWQIMHNFEDHYKVQQLTGHAQFIAHMYDCLNPAGKNQRFVGTLHNHFLSASDRSEMLKFLALKDELEYGSPKEKERAWASLSSTYSHFLQSHKSGELALLKDVFHGTSIYDSLIDTNVG